MMCNELKRQKKMKSRNLYMAVCLMAAAVFLPGCSKELDDLESPVVGTETSGSTDETDGDVLRIQVSDAGYRDGKTGSRATDSGLKTIFEDGDKIGLFVVNSQNEVLYANVLYTKSGADWTAAQNVRTKGYPVRVFAYYPYVEDTEITGKVDATAQDASAFFKTYIEGLDISNQNTPELYRKADVMACMVTVDDKEAAREKLTLSMSHLLGQVVVKLPTEVTITAMNYYLKGDENFTWQVVLDKKLPANLSDESFTVSGIQPLKEETGYRYLCKSGDNNISFSGGFTTYEAEKGYSVSNATVSAGSIKTYNVSVTPFAAPGKAEYIPQVGDFFMSDGAILPRVSDSNKNNCIGIVYWLPTAADPLESHRPTWLAEHSTCTHGLVLGLKEERDAWGTAGETTGIIDSNTDGVFRGYSNTQRLVSERPGYPIVSAYNSLTGVTLPSGKTSGWYVPSEGELVKLYNVISKVNASLRTLGNPILSSSEYWSSGEYGGNNAWAVTMVNGYMSNISKTYRCNVRLAFAF